MPNPPATLYMPEFDLGQWRETSFQSHPADDQHRYAYRFSVYDRVRLRTPALAAAMICALLAVRSA